MDSKGKYIGTLVLIFILRFLDCYITFLITPELSQEWNPLVSYFGMSWFGFLLSQSILYLLAVVGLYCYMSRDESRVERENLRYGEFVYFYFNGRLDPLKGWVKSFLSLPTLSIESAKKHLSLLGFIYTFSAIFISLFAIFHNLLIFYNVEVYAIFTNTYNSKYFLAVFLLSILLSSQTYFILEYNRYRNS